MFGQYEKCNCDDTADKKRIKKGRAGTKDKGEDADTEKGGTIVRAPNPKKSTEVPEVPKSDSDLLTLRVKKRQDPPWSRARRQSRVVDIAEVHEEFGGSPSSDEEKVIDGERHMWHKEHIAWMKTMSSSMIHP